jgi:hypothetical protein
MSRFRKIVLSSVPARAHRLWLLCVTWPSPSFTDKALLKLLLPDGTLLLIRVKLFGYCFPEALPYNNSQALNTTVLFLAKSGEMCYTKGDAPPLHMPFEHIARHPLQSR